MPQVAEHRLSKGKIIEIVSFDDNSRKTLRRVRVKSLRDHGGSTVEIVGVNMKGKNSIEYDLPREPLTDIVRQSNTIGWLPFVDNGEGDE